MAKAGLTREKIIDVAGLLADESGFEKLTLTAVAQHFHVRLPSLYGHVANSEDLKKGVALLALEQLAERAEDAVAGRSGKDALQALANAHREFACQHPGLFHATRYPLDPNSAPGNGGTRLARVSLAMLRGYGLPEDESVHAIRLFGSFVLGFSLLETAGSFAHRLPPSEHSWERGIDAIDALIRSWSKD
ncbi:WHG domain-containing protein [Martelella mediterranea]|uniref:TetR/AcrR family transcriptional regulator n=1 Tax=Martelella mediterranea TaxID=293089 RepID=UPI001E440D04|nr:TetR/AcrR family transcriptional regulator [Martelella mediterranea]MCD1634813.1 WHG domain-containing protein [Martelella mediterranea]